MDQVFFCLVPLIYDDHCMMNTFEEMKYMTSLSEMKSKIDMPVSNVYTKYIIIYHCKNMRVALTLLVGHLCSFIYVHKYLVFENCIQSLLSVPFVTQVWSMQGTNTAIKSCLHRI